MIGLLVIPHQAYRDFCLMDIPQEENKCEKIFNTLFKDFKKINGTDISVLDDFMEGLRQRYITSSTVGNDVWDFYHEKALMNFNNIVAPVMLYIDGRDMSEDEVKAIMNHMKTEITMSRAEHNHRMR